MIPAGIQIGVGTWSWGDRLTWGFGADYNENDLQQVFQRALHDGVYFFASSEAFAEGKTECLLGEFMRQAQSHVVISTKYVPRYWRVCRSDFFDALKHSLMRLNRGYVDIYEIMPPVGLMDIRLLAQCSAEALDLGLTRQIGLSNYNLEQMTQFSELLSRFGYIPACLETEYSLLNRKIETNGVLDFCRQQNITLIAQNPLAMGFLSGKYDYQLPAEGSRRQFMRKYCNPRFELLIRLMNNIGAENGGKDCAQVSLNWLMRKNVVPIPGAKTLEQVMMNDQAGSWLMTEEEALQLDNLSWRINEKDG